MDALDEAAYAYVGVAQTVAQLTNFVLKLNGQELFVRVIRFTRAQSHDASVIVLVTRACVQAQHETEKETTRYPMIRLARHMGGHVSAFVYGDSKLMRRPAHLSAVTIDGAAQVVAALF